MSWSASLICLCACLAAAPAAHAVPRETLALAASRDSQSESPGAAAQATRRPAGRELQRGSPNLETRRSFDPRRVERARDRALSRGLALDFNITLAKCGFVIGALALLVLGWRLRALGRPERYRRTRQLALLLLAVAAFAASYNFFIWRHYDGIHAHEVFHYYLGSKYFPELGYFGLYECSVVAASEGRPAETSRRHVIRNLRDIDERTSVLPEQWGPRCNGAFSAERWREFREDVRWIKARLPGAIWQRVIIDQGFNASPVWVLFGRPLSAVFPTEAAAMRLLVRVDLLLVLLAFAAVAWAFGFEGLCLVVLVWSANPLSRYQWVGDAMLRQLWFSSSVLGLCLLARRKTLAAGTLLATSALLRVFPVFFALGYVVGRLRSSWANRTFDRDLARFLAAAVATSLLLVAAATWVCGRGPGVLLEFGKNMASYSSLTAQNSIGLRPLLSFSTRRPAPFVVDGKLQLTDRSFQELYEKTFASRRPIYFAAVALFLLLFWRALAKLQGWEAAALGYVLILVFTQAGSYYMTCTVAAALLATSRPRIAFATLLALLGWCASALYYFEDPKQYAWSSAVALLLAFFVLLEMQRRPQTAPPPAGA